MHIPDGFLDAKTAAATSALSILGVGLALRMVRRELPPRKTPLLGLSAAFLFAAQMVNFPVAGGTSGHLIGGSLVAALLGPSAAIVVLTAVLIVQCFMFADGGVTALGANVFNMAILASVGGYLIYRAVSRCLPGTRGQVTAIAFAGWCSVALASTSAAGQLACSGTVAWSIAFPAMTGTHLLIGIGEGLITALIFLVVLRARPDMISEASSDRPKRLREMLLYGSLATLGVAIFVAPFACSWPDGLEHVAAKLGFEHKATAQVISTAIAPDYHTPGIQWAAGATAIAGAVGSLIAFALALLLGYLAVPRPRNTAGDLDRAS